MRPCNEFNCFGSGDISTFQGQLACAVGTLARDRALQTSVLVDKYGPYCDNETKGHPFAANLIAFVDRYADHGGERKCTTESPPSDPRPGDEGKTCSDPSFTRTPGTPIFDFYRGALNSDSCSMKTNGWPTGATDAQIKDSLQGAYYDIHQLDAVDSAKVDQVIAAARIGNVNPYLLFGIWATESGFGQIESCQ